ncbi:MAG: alkaline phosphatase family protein [Candidatus Krumholzibacteriota bacterium]|nr:alkaline phosphatase family protein [Candidatus Krumholzibacteriota bacterium]
MSATVIIIIDALGYDITDHHGFGPAGLEKKGRVKSVFGFSQAALTSIMTGEMPEKHGLWMMYSFDQKDSPFRWLRPMPRFVSTERRWVRRAIDAQIAKAIGVSAYYNIYSVPSRVLSFLDIPARKQLFSPGSVPGCETMIDRGLKAGIPVFIRYYDTEERKAFEELSESLSENEEGLFILYTAGLDSTLHRFGTASVETREHLGWYQETIERILSLRKDTRFFLLGDHGMCDVTGTIDIKSRVEGLGLKIPDDYIPFYDSTMARFRVNSDKGKILLEQDLGAAGGGRLLDEKELRRLGVWFDDGRFGDMIFIADPGTMIIPGFMGDSPIAGMHGYHPDAQCMDSALYANSDTGSDNISLTDIADMVIPKDAGKGSHDV